MRSLRPVFTRVVNSVTGQVHDGRLRDEIEEHIALKTVENVRAGGRSCSGGVVAGFAGYVDSGATRAVGRPFETAARGVQSDSLPKASYVGPITPS